MNHIEENLSRIKEEIEKAANKSGRDPSKVKLVCITKTLGIDEMMAAYNAGHKIFGESYVQEALPKIENLPKDIEWHFVGHLQGNKVKYVGDKFKLIHGVDSLKTLAEFKKKNFKQDVLVELNIASECSKCGISEGGLFKFIEEASKIDGIALRGLMIYPPLFDDPEKARPFFRKGKMLAEELIKKGYIKNCELSMGMSSDYKVAIEEGATIVRVGSAVFGERK